MTDHTHADQLTPLDLPMPRTYIRVLFVFPTANSNPQITQPLQRGLEKLSKQVPWVAGYVFHTTPTNQKASLEIRYRSAKTPTLEDKGQITASYANLSSQDMPMKAIPPDVWPTLPCLLGNIPSEKGDRVFAASFFRFADHGAGLCICLHHNAVDVTGFAEVVRLWARNVVQPGQTDSSCLPHGSGVVGSNGFPKLSRLICKRFHRFHRNISLHCTRNTQHNHPSYLIRFRHACPKHS